MEPEFKDQEHKWIWDFLSNHIKELREDIREVRGWQWKLTLTFIGLGGTLIIALILALMKIM